jgi:hypothetical protein
MTGSQASPAAGHGGGYGAEEGGGKGAAMGTSGRARRRSAWHGMARGGDGRGAELSPWEKFKGERKRTTGKKGRVARERGKVGGGGVASLGISRGTPWWPGRQAGGGHGGHLGASTQVPHEEDK